MDASIMGRTGADVLKKHKQIIAHARKHIMPGYHAFFTRLGKPPSGTAIEDCHREVLNFHWDSLEEERLHKLSKKGPKEEAKAESQEAVSVDEAPPQPTTSGKENDAQSKTTTEPAPTCPTSAAAGLLVSFGNTLGFGGMGGFWPSTSAGEPAEAAAPAALERHTLVQHQQPS